MPTTAEGTITMGVTSDRVERMLTKHGYRVLRDTGDHTLYEHHGDRIVVPLHSRELSPWSARMIEWSLEHRLGRGWLTEQPDPSTAEVSDPAGPGRPAPLPVRRNLVVRPEPDRSAWNAFVVEEPRILTFGSSLAEVQDRAADAARAWYADAPPVELLPHLQLDPAADRWVGVAGEPGCPPARRTEALRELGALGFAAGDAVDLVSWPHPRSSAGRTR